ncbi:NAD(P)-binding protein [Xylaria acuta]|nr:NAD(P)-binding protein [Xylaria acuta]
MASKKVLIIGPGYIGWNILFHTATADDLPSAEAILDGIQERADSGLGTIYIHTSGTAMTSDDGRGAFKSNKVYHDDVTTEIDSLSDDAPHRQVDIPIVKAQKRLGAKAKIAIMVPPTIYGVNPKHGRLSMQIPTLARYALKRGFSGYVGEGLSVHNNIHVLDIARATRGTTSQAGRKSPLLSETDRTPRPIPEDTYGDVCGSETDAGVGMNSRTRAVRLRALEWKPVEKNWQASFAEGELPCILKEGRQIRGQSGTAFSGVAEWKIGVHSGDTEVTLRGARLSCDCLFLD